MSITRHNKLVRDRIPEHLSKGGHIFSTRIINDDNEYREALRDKLIEEVNEFLQSESIEEIADILEVLDAICELKKFKKGRLSSVKKKKAKERGEFKKRIFLISVSSSH